MSLVAITVTLTLTWGPAGITSTRLDVNPLIAVPFNLPESVPAMTLPGVLLYKPERSRPNNLGGIRTTYSALSLPWTIPHELHHFRQEAALGPWFWVAYAATVGRAFEPYDPLDRRPPQNWSNAWMPPPSMTDDYPLLRFDAHGAHLLPGYF